MQSLLNVILVQLVVKWPKIEAWSIVVSLLAHLQPRSVRESGGMGSLQFLRRWIAPAVTIYAIRIQLRHGLIEGSGGKNAACWFWINCALVVENKLIGWVDEVPSSEEGIGCLIPEFIVHDQHTISDEDSFDINLITVWNISFLLNQCLSSIGHVHSYVDYIRYPHRTLLQSKMACLYSRWTCQTKFWLLCNYRLQLGRQCKRRLGLGGLLKSLLQRETRGRGDAPWYSKTIHWAWIRFRHCRWQMVQFPTSTRALMSILGLHWAIIW